MSIKTHIINYDAIKKHLEEEDIRDPNRTWTSFDLLLLNTKNTLKWLIHWDEKSGRTVAIDLDDTHKEVTVFWNPLQYTGQIIVLGYLKDKPQNEHIYQLFTELVDYAHRNKQYDYFFREIPNKNT